MSKWTTLVALTFAAVLGQTASTDSQGRLGERVQPFTRLSQSRLKATTG
jgi:hypothetical protein